jgi:hypothetical protein
MVIKLLSETFGDDRVIMSEKSFLVSKLTKSTFKVPKVGKVNKYIYDGMFEVFKT